jgi:LEA14-like dessication related protein
MKNLKAILVLSGLGIIGYSLYRYYTKQIDFLKDITYQVVGLKIVNIAKDNISLDITNRIYNASNVEAIVTEMYLDFYLNNVLIGNVNEAKDLLILPLKTTDITYRFTFNPQLVIKNLVSVVTFAIAAKDMTFEARGYAKVKSGFVETTIPFEYKNNLKSFLK